MARKTKKKPTIANVCGACGMQLRWVFDELGEPFYAIGSDHQHHFPDLCWESKMKRVHKEIERRKKNVSRPDFF